MGEETPRVDARGARAFDATLSVPGREELKQTGMRVRVVPAPAWTPRASREAAFQACETDAPVGGAAGASASAPNAAETRKNAPLFENTENIFAAPPDAWSTPVTPAAMGAMTVIGFWEPGGGVDPLGALHLIAGARGPSARLVAAPSCFEKEKEATSETNLEGVEALHAELSEKMKTAVVSIAGGKREVHLCAIPADDPDETTERVPPRDPDATRSKTANAEEVLKATETETETAAENAAGAPRKKEGFHFLAFETRAMAPFHHAPILAQKQLAVIFDLDETLLQAFTLSSLDRRADAIRKAHESAERAGGDGGDEKGLFLQSRAAREASDAATDAAGKTVAGALGAQPARAFADRPPADALRQARQRREEDMARLKHDRAMLMQYVAENCVTDARGRRHAAAAESATTAPGEVTFRPVIRLPSPHCRGGQMIFTRIDPANKGTSMLVHVRPGWEEMHGYLAGLDRARGAARERAASRCAAFVCTMSEPSYAQEMWRLLDPRGALIAAKDLAHKVVSVKQGAELKTLDKAVGPWGVAKSLCVVLDDRTAVWEPRARPHILAVAPFMPYATDTGPGLRGEAPGEAGVLGAARRMLDKTRMDLFMTYERFARFHAARPNAPFEPPARALTPAARPVEPREVEKAEPPPREEQLEPLPEPLREVFRTSRPQPPDVAQTLPPLMRAHAKEAAREVAQMGGAARSAAGAGSRLNAMLGGIAAPQKRASAAKTLASASFGKSAGADLNPNAARDPSGADDGAREKAKAAAAAAIKLAAEEKARERAERETRNAPERPFASGAEGDEGDGDKSDLSGPGVDSDEERARKEDARAEAGLGESSESDSEPDDLAKASARAPGDARGEEAKATRGAKKDAPRKRRNACQTCAERGLTPTDHFRFCKSCPFHPEHVGEKGKKPNKTAAEASPATDEKRAQTAPASERSASDSEAAATGEEEDGGGERETSSRSPSLEPAPKPARRKPKKARGLRDGGDAGSDGNERAESLDAESLEHAEQSEDAGDDATAAKRKRRDEKAWSPPPEVTAESEIPAAKPSPSKPNAKKQKVSQKSQREAMLKKLSGKRR